MTLLQIAVSTDDVVLLHLLLKAGAPVGRLIVRASLQVDQVYKGSTALSLAARQGNATMVHLLLEAGARWRVETPDRQVVVLAAAARARNLEMMELLLDAGAPVR